MKHLLPLVFLFTILFTKGQDTILVLNKKFKQYGLLEKKYKSLASFDPISQCIYVTLADNKTIERYIIDKSSHIENQFSSQRGI